MLNAFLYQYLVTFHFIIWFHWSIVKFSSFIHPYFVRFANLFLFCFLKSISIYNIFLVFILITHNTKQIPLLNLLINFIFAKSAQQILSLKDKYTFRLSKFLIFGLCNSSANCQFGIISLSITDLFACATAPSEMLAPK